MKKTPITASLAAMMVLVPVNVATAKALKTAVDAFGCTGRLVTAGPSSMIRISRPGADSLAWDNHVARPPDGVEF